MPLLLEKIEALLDDPAPAACASAVVRIERALTDGYAGALALEGERLRIDRQIETVAAAMNSSNEGSSVQELSLLTRRRRVVDCDLAHLRERLELLRRRAREIRSAVPRARIG